MNRMSFEVARGCRAMLIAAACLPLSVGLAGCGKTSKSADSPTSSTSTTLSPDTAAILEAYRHFQEIYIAVGNPINPSDPRLEEVATGSELTSLRKALTGLKVDGEVIEGTITVAPVLVSKSATEATLRDCSVDASRFVKQATGATVGDGSTTRELTTVTMSFVDGRWKVSDIKHLGSGCTSAS